MSEEARTTSLQPHLAELAPTIEALRKTIFDDAFRNSGFALDGRFRRAFEKIASMPVHRLIHLAYDFDKVVEGEGLVPAMRWLLPQFTKGVDVSGAETIPHDGPVLFLANHPGTFDEVAISANIPRPDLKIVANSFPILRALPAVRQHCIFASADVHTRMNVVRSMIKNLRNGNTLLLFPTGRVEPDPRLIDGAAESLNDWSTSIEMLLQKAPETRVVVAIVSGVVSPVFHHSPLTWVRRHKVDRQKIAEGFQVLFQVLFHRNLGLVPKVTFGEPITAEQFTDEPGALYQGILEQARDLLALHAPQPAT